MEGQPVAAAAWLLPALAFAVATSATPGPNNAMLAASGANFGFRRTLPHILGVTVGFPLLVILVILVALGAGAVLRAWPGIDAALRWVGAAYLLSLAWRIATARPEIAGRRTARPLSFLQAAAFQWVNPKAWVIAASAVVTYTSGGPALPAQSAALALLFLIVTLPATSFWTGLGVGAGRLLRRQGALRAFNLAMAALLVVSLVPLLGEAMG